MRLATPLFLLGTFLLAVPLAAQPVVPVAPVPGALNAAVNDAGVVEGTIFELQRGARYITTEQLNPLVSVTIRAAGTGDCVTTFQGIGTGEFPGCALMQTGDPGGGGDTFRLFDIRDHDPITLTLEDVALTNRTPNGVAENRQVRVRTDDTSVFASDVVFFDETEDVIRLDGPNASVILDTVLGGKIGSFDDDGNPVGSEGNFIDTRDSNVNEISIVNGTFYSINNTLIRTGRADIGRIELRNNTIHHGRRHVIDESGGDEDRSIIGETFIENLMVINVGFEGAEADDDITVFDADTLDANGSHLIRNINFFLDPDDIEGEGEVFILSDAFAPYISEDDLLTEGPSVLMFADPQPAPFEGFDQQPFDYSYTGGQSVTGGSDGQPIGALIWFGLTVDSEGDPDALAFRLDGAAPNPSAGAATLHYTLDEPADIRLEVFDVLGRRVAVVAEGVIAAGPHTAPVNMAAFPAGLYVVRLVADGATQTTRMTVVR
jgi:hypothetical protein